ncbi:Threonine dehydratase [Roseovarius sp. EC-HK134]|nr:Threonine dehydratase [Roseovarius sp. EC-HK134]VVT07465.1 Threonine dehydratase [Roseovarius sp. EC-SD190]
MRDAIEIVIAAASVLMTLAALALADRPAMALLSGSRAMIVPGYASGSGAILPPQIRTATRSPAAGR